MLVQPQLSSDTPKKKKKKEGKEGLANCQMGYTSYNSTFLISFQYGWQVEENPTSIHKILKTGGPHIALMVMVTQENFDIWLVT